MKCADHLELAVAQEKTVIITPTDHKVAIAEGMEILNNLNDWKVEENRPFVLVGYYPNEDMKYWWYKICCKVYRDLFYLYPPKKNLAANLKNHVIGIKHLKALKDSNLPNKNFLMAIVNGR